MVCGITWRLEALASRCSNMRHGTLVTPWLRQMLDETAACTPQ